jgi:hypothetical protein
VVVGVAGSALDYLVLDDLYLVLPSQVPDPVEDQDVIDPQAGLVLGYLVHNAFVEQQH